MDKDGTDLKENGINPIHISFVLDECNFNMDCFLLKKEKLLPQGLTIAR